jgi:hypothetical protein
MLQDAVNAKPQIKKWIEHQTYFPPFTVEDWDRLQQIEGFLARFEEFTLTVSKREPQITLAIPIYYELHDLLHDAASREGEFSNVHPEISVAAAAGLKKFQKYYNLMDGQDAYYVALVLDPRFQTLLLDRDLGKVTAPNVVTHIKELLHEQYPLISVSSTKPPMEQPTAEKSIEATSVRMGGAVWRGFRGREDIVHPLHEEPAAAPTSRCPATREWSDCRPGA